MFIKMFSNMIINKKYLGQFSPLPVENYDYSEILNYVPVAHKSREPACPQARNPTVSARKRPVL